MESYKFLLDLALILLSTKVLGLLTRKLNLPQVVGALVAGLILGPGLLNVISQTNYIYETAEIGVVVLMFCAGMETDVDELKRSGKISMIIAVIGMVVPLAGGFIVAAIFQRPGLLPSDASTSLMLQNIFIGVTLTATSVSITVETLKEIGKLKSPAGNMILGAAVIDDILGVIALTLITSLSDSSVNVVVVLLKIVGFFVFAAVAGYGFYKVFTKYIIRTKKGLQRYTIFSFVFCLLMAYIAEEVFGVADITGAYIAGMVISRTNKENYLESRFNILSYAYLSPMFFASIGLKVVLPKMSFTVVAFAVILTIVAVLTKVVGCGLGAKIGKFSNREALQIGVGMVSRGEVALIIASKGEALGMLGSDIMGPLVLMVIITTILTPILLKIVFKSKTPTLALQSH